MRELTVNETDATSGGVAVTIAVSLVTTLVGAYLYEKAGGAKGIENKVKKAAKFVADSYAKACEASPTCGVAL